MWMLLAALHLQTAQRLLYGQSPVWDKTASVLLRGVSKLDYDKHLFLLDLQNLDLNGTSAFYQSVFKAWNSMLTSTRDRLFGRGAEEPLFHNLIFFFFFYKEEFLESFI